MCRVIGEKAKDPETENFLALAQGKLCLGGETAALETVAMASFNGATPILSKEPKESASRLFSYILDSL